MQNPAWPWRLTSYSLVYWVAGSCLDSGQRQRHNLPLEKGSSTALHCAFSRCFNVKAIKAPYCFYFCFPQSCLFLLTAHTCLLPLYPSSPLYYAYHQWLLAVSWAYKASKQFMSPSSWKEVGPGSHASNVEKRDVSPVRLSKPITRIQANYFWHLLHVSYL